MTSNKATVERARTKEALTLFLYNPIPGFALVCFDDHPTKTAPLSFQKVVDDLGDRRQNLDMQFVLCSSAFDANVGSAPSKNPAYVLFRCGADFQELGRMTASRDVDCQDDLTCFILRKRGDSNDLEDTLYQKLGITRTRTRLNGFLKYMNKLYKIDLEEVNSEGKAFLTCLNHVISIQACGRGGGMIRLLSFIGKETHGGDAALLLEVLQWNFGGETHLGQFCIGVDRQTARFTLECYLHNVEENGWNEVNFHNFVCNFAASCETIDEKIKGFKKNQEETKAPAQKSQLSCEQLRATRLSKFGSENEEIDMVTNKGQVYHCWCCRKYFQAEPQLKNHMHSKKHKQRWRKCKADFRKHQELEDTLIIESKNQVPVAPSKDRYETKAELHEARLHRKVLRELLTQEKLERKMNGGKLKSKLGIDGYRPTGTFYDINSKY